MTATKTKATAKTMTVTKTSTAMSYLIQQTTNRMLDLITDSRKSNTPLPNDLALSRDFDVSRTSIRTVIDYLCEHKILKREGNQKLILRLPKTQDYFDISNESSTKEEQFEKFFLSLINTGKLLPGDRFSELDLAKKSNCITITVREFLIKFSHTGLIQKKPREQWQMVEFDEKFALELVSFRKILEMTSIRALLERPTDDPVWQELEQLLKDHKTLLADFDNNYNDFPALDARLHRAIQSSSGNRFINQFFNIVTFVCHYHYQWDKSDEKERNATAVVEHIDLLTKLLLRDISGSIMSLENHLNTAQKTLMRSVHGLVE
jgi:GntR family transcriptional regulator, transcriptional activator for L-galactonate catabolism